MIQTIKLHNHNYIICNFIQDKKAVSFDNKYEELFYWDVSDM